METSGWLRGVFDSVDKKDADGFVSFLTDDAVFRFASADPVKGKKAIQKTLSAFFDSISALEHEILETWYHSDTVVCRGTVTYTRHDSSRLTVPFVNVFKMQGRLIREYLIYADASALYSES